MEAITIQAFKRRERRDRKRAALFAQALRGCQPPQFAVGEVAVLGPLHRDSFQRLGVSRDFGCSSLIGA
jgi:hypothetical protein